MRRELKGTTRPPSRDLKRKYLRNTFCRAAWRSGQLAFTVESWRCGVCRTPQDQARQQANADQRTSLAGETNLASVNKHAPAPPGLPRRQSELNLCLQEMRSPRQACCCPGSPSSMLVPAGIALEFNSATLRTPAQVRSH